MFLPYRVTPPKIVEKFANVTTQEGKELLLRARVTGTQPVMISWMRDETPLKASKRIQIASEGDLHTLKINPVEQDDEGDFMIVAKNSAGIDKWVAEVLVEGNQKPFLLCFTTLCLIAGNKKKEIAFVTLLFKIM